jgi:hypothetical protein
MPQNCPSQWTFGLIKVWPRKPSLLLLSRLRCFLTSFYNFPWGHCPLWSFTSRMQCASWAQVWEWMKSLILVQGYSLCFYFSHFYLFNFLMGLEFELRASHLKSRCSIAWTTPPVHFCSVYFGDGVSQTICPVWPQNMVLPISDSQIARIIDESCQCLSLFIFRVGILSHFLYVFLLWK